MPVMHDTPLALSAETTIREYFRESVCGAISHQKLDADDHTVLYVVNLLEHFSRSDRLFENTPEGYVLQPLAMHYSRAVEALRPDERQQALRRLGDVALLISGLFANSLNRKAVDIDYYIAMGSSAYGFLSDTARRSVRTAALRDIFAELSAKFQAFVDVLAEVGENSGLVSSTDMLRLYDIWAKTGSRRAADQLRKRGIEPLTGSVSRRHN